MLSGKIRLLQTLFGIVAALSVIALTFLGGSSHELGAGIKVDGAGKAYLVGTTQSPGFPTSPGAFRRTGAPSNVSEVFVSKLNPAGTALVYSTFLGKTGSEAATGITLDATGNAWLTGITGSTDFPVTPDAFDLTFNGGADAFVAELSADGSSLLYSTYLRGTQSEGVDQLALGADGDVYVTSYTHSLDFPTTAGAFDIVFNGDTPSQTISCDWSDVPGAASYMIEVDDVSGFTAPLVHDVSVAASQYVTSGLAGTQQFWRGRAVNSVGVAGAWSVIRSF